MWYMRSQLLKKKKKTAAVRYKISIMRNKAANWNITLELGEITASSIMKFHTVRYEVTITRNKAAILRHKIAILREKKNVIVIYEVTLSDIKPQLW